MLQALHKIGATVVWIVTRPLAAYWWLRGLRVELWLVEGEERTSGLPLSIACAVRGENKKFLLGTVFGGTFRQRSLGRFWLWQLARALPATATDCSLMVLELTDSYLGFAKGSDWFLIPAWVIGKADLPRDAAALRKVSRNLRRLRRHAFQYEVTRDSRQFDDFYYNMYVPYITERHGPEADLSSYEDLKTGFQDCDLLLIKDREKTIAGQLIRYESWGPHLWEMGVRDGNRDYVAGGAVGSAVFHFSLEYLQGKGHTEVWLGWSRPFLRDGVLQFKRSWSQRIAANGNRHLALRIVSDSPAARAFLCNNPFIFKDGGRFFGAMFVDGNRRLSADDLRQIDKDYFHDGLSRLLIYDLGGRCGPMFDAAPAELAAHIELRCLGDRP